MTGNVAQVFLTDQGWAQALAGCHRALRDDGHLVFETRAPSARAWEVWKREAAEQPEIVRQVTGVGAVAQCFELTRVDLPLVSFRYSYRFADDGTTVVSDSVLRFRSRQEVTRSLERAGFSVLEVRDAPGRPGLEHVFLARRSQ